MNKRGNASKGRISTNSPYKDRSNFSGEDQKLAYAEYMIFREFKEEATAQKMRARWEQESGAGMKELNTGEYE